jgi:hypothetical protein
LKPVPFENRVFGNRAIENRVLEIRILNLRELGAICVSSIMEAVFKRF